ncbi:hypothetical protein BK666_07150 [Pseudomonas frederiksbergensis]|uniref:Uncharacterized protein n=1 Tax=Pseudomonas frederiksbergensis TaxID=104087 RepID=A0A423KBD0_9PSED|nr:hypothetical protein BK666_07150 [Pseudomonas frederiksbergensis]
MYFVNHSMAIWAKRYEIFYWMDFVSGRPSGNVYPMVNVDVVFSELSINFVEVKFAYETLASKMLYAFFACKGVPFNNG